MSRAIRREVKASGKSLRTKGFLDILGVEDDSKIEIPNLQVGDILQQFGSIPVQLEKKATQPPARFSEDKLIKELVSRNIGRPATYADLLGKITHRNYVEKKGSVFHATDLGKLITDELSKFFSFMDYNYTARMEEQLDQIEDGKLDHIEMLNAFYPPFKEELSQAYLGHGGSLCPKCQSPLSTRNNKEGGKFLACSAYPRCKFTQNVATVETQIVA
jgi:DNA topoisomerase-1